jgi:ferric-dicitrate binding protein FerR (iron transport regulator)
METKDHFTEKDELLVKYISGEAGEDERKAVSTWIDESVENRRYFYELKEIYIASKTAQKTEFYNIDHSWEKVKSKHYRELVRKLRDEKNGEKWIFFRDFLKYAAIFVLAISIGYTGFRYFKNEINPEPDEIWNNVAAPYGSRAYLTLADGSKVWLNAGSNLRYSSFFGQTGRKVFLDGEAYFSVKTDSSKQFIVSTSHLEIKVYGTEFNVKAYSDEDIIQTTLVNGSVILEGDLVTKTGKRLVKLMPNQTATYYISDKKSVKNIPDTITLPKTALPVTSNLIIIPEINPVIYTSWKDPNWYIEREPLSSLAEKFERRFNIKFVFNSKALQEYKFTGTLKDETLEQVLNLMKLSAPIEYRIENNQVVFTENKFFKKSYDEMLINKYN